MRGIFKYELPASDRNYYVSKQHGYTRDYLSLQRWLAVLKDTETPSGVLRNEGATIVKLAKRIHERLFDVEKSPISRVVNKIPVYVDKHLRQAIIGNKPWMDFAGISCKVDIPRNINGFMTSRQFKRVLSEIFYNIRRHNFELPENELEIKKDYISYSIEVKAKQEQSHIVILIRSNGPKTYDNSEHQGIRLIKDICKQFEADYNIGNHDEWVENKISLRRW